MAGQTGRGLRSRIHPPAARGREKGLRGLSVVANLHVAEDPADGSVDELARKVHVLAVLPHEGIVEKSERVVDAIHIGGSRSADRNKGVVLEELVLIGKKERMRKGRPVPLHGALLFVVFDGFVKASEKERIKGAIGKST